MFDPALHLFIDDFHIRTVFGLKRTFGSLEKMSQPVLEDIPDRRSAWACVLREPDGLFRMWYQTVFKESVHDIATAGVWGRGDEYGYFPDRHDNPVLETQTSGVSYAESNDGLQWHKPELGLYEWRGNKKNNIVLDGSHAATQFDGALTNMDTVSVIRDESDPDPLRRYKLICHWETIHVWDNWVSQLDRSEENIKRFWAARAKYLTVSPDGIHWNPKLTRIKECAGGGDYAGVTIDERNNRYWFSDRAPVGLPEVRYRSAGLCSSPDLYKWPETVEMVFSPSAHEDYGQRYEHHGMVPFNYGDQDLCFLEYSLGGSVIAGILGTHRDNERWQRANGDTPVLNISPKGSFDDTSVAVTRNAPFRIEDRLLFFYRGTHAGKNLDSCLHTSHIGAASLRLDGFAAMEVDSQFVRQAELPAMLISTAVKVRENKLQINISDHGQSARVGLLSEDMQPIPGFELEACLALPEDAVRATVHWREQQSTETLIDKKVHLLIQMDAGKLYAFHL